MTRIKGMKIWVSVLYCYCDLYAFNCLTPDGRRYVSGWIHGRATTVDAIKWWQSKKGVYLVETTIHDSTQLVPYEKAQAAN